LGPHDHKLQRLIGDASEALSAAEKAQVLAGMANAPFAKEPRTLKEWNVTELAIEGMPHPSIPGTTVLNSTSLASADWHTLKHTKMGDWPAGTTTHEYLADLRATIQLSTVLHVGRASAGRRMASRAACHVETTLALARLKVSSKITGTDLFALYDPARGVAVSVYPVRRADIREKLAKWQQYRVF
jgi:hypothetical protein